MGKSKGENVQYYLEKLFIVDKELGGKAAECTIY